MTVDDDTGVSNVGSEYHPANVLSALVGVGIVPIAVLYGTVIVFGTPVPPLACNVTVTSSCQCA